MLDTVWNRYSTRTVAYLDIHKGFVAHEEVEHVATRGILHSDAQVSPSQKHLPELRHGGSETVKEQNARHPRMKEA